MSLEHTCNAIRSRVLHGTDEGGFIDAVACCDWERALNCADQFHFANFTEIMRWRIVTLPRLKSLTDNIDLPLLKRQKLTLVELLMANDRLNPAETEALDGILNLLDHIQDELEDVN